MSAITDDELIELEISSMDGHRTTHVHQADIIDLTEEPDSPPISQQALPRHYRNPRRQPGLRRSPPSLTRSDSGFLGAQPAIIDLTRESPERQRTPRSQSQSQSQSHNGNLDDVILLEGGFDQGPAQPLGNIDPHHGEIGPPRSMGRLPGVPSIIELMARNMSRGMLQWGRPPQQLNVIGFYDPNPLAGGVPLNLNYERQAFAQQQPAREPTPKRSEPAREGFTRDTGADVVVVCPACGEELEYDPDEKVEETVTSSKRAKTRREKGEHHFWALKSCGHVYCRDCFENRRPSTKTPRRNFRWVGNEKEPVSQTKMLCAVEDCLTEVGQKTAWVGIYL